MGSNLENLWLLLDDVGEPVTGLHKSDKDRLMELAVTRPACGLVNEQREHEEYSVTGLDSDGDAAHSPLGRRGCYLRG